MNSNDRIIPLRDAARDYLGNPSKYVLGKITRTLPVVKLSPKYRAVRLSDLEKWLASNTGNTGAQV